MFELNDGEGKRLRRSLRPKKGEAAVKGREKSTGESPRLEKKKEKGKIAIPLCSKHLHGQEGEEKRGKFQLPLIRKKGECLGGPKKFLFPAQERDLSFQFQVAKKPSPSSGTGKKRKKSYSPTHWKERVLLPARNPFPISFKKKGGRRRGNFLNHTL